MNDQKLHIIITGESGSGRNFVICKNRVRKWSQRLAIFCLFFVVGGILCGKYFLEKSYVQEKITAISTQKDKEIATLKRRLSNLESVLKAGENNSSHLVELYEQQLSALEEEKEKLLEASVSRLDERSKFIESLIHDIGVEVKIEDDPNHSGGLFIPAKREYGERLINNTEQYLEVLSHLPLGRPVPTRITSGYGKRFDPLNKKKAFHEGVDFKGRSGDPIVATADAKVKVSTKTKGFGHYIVLDHGNGYQTYFAHMSKRLVKKGERVKRGQKIGLVGSSGRSTGPHLHYELHYRGNDINPMKFIKVANLSLTLKQ